MKENFTKKLRLRKDNVERLNQINEIVEEYMEQGQRLTLRQLYYQLVSRDMLSNSQKEYKKLGKILVKGRMAGIVDWYAIEDRGRRPQLPYYALNVQDALTDTIDQYRLDRQSNQKNYIELWIEKDALSGVMSRMCYKYHVRLMVNKGYSSASAMYNAYNRVVNALGNDQNVCILYLGDHDPSGLHMIQDIKERLMEMVINSARMQKNYDWINAEESENFDSIARKYRKKEMFWVDGEFCIKKAYAFHAFKTRFSIVPVALTMAQIKKYKPPPNPAKIDDPRAHDYIKKFGDVSWEVDALKPDVLNSLVEKQIIKRIDLDLYNEILRQEDYDKEKLRAIK